MTGLVDARALTYVPGDHPGFEALISSDRRLYWAQKRAPPGAHPDLERSP